jgi:hypothetical protein
MSPAVQFKADRFKLRLELINNSANEKTEKGFTKIAPIVDGRVKNLGTE